MEKIFVGQKCKYIRESDGVTYEGVIEKINEKAQTAIIKGGWTPDCRYVARIRDILMN